LDDHPNLARFGHATFISISQPPFGDVVKPLSEVPKSIRFGGRMVMWAVTNGQPDLAGTCISIEQLLHAASFDSVVVGRLSTDSGDMMVATALFQPVRSHCGLLH
jgi:hypothetical protein